MGNNIAIEFEHVSKQYRLGLVSTKTLSHDIRRFWITNVLGKEDPYLKIGETNDRASKGTSEYVWALRDIDFKVEQGDVVGIIGKNGAGKSTLLKLLSRVTGPTTGTIRAHGRIGSLLEVGTGFHGEMTGRENIFMNGAILGMSRAEIQSKLDEIIDFSGCERYIDTPVKRYSSGMTVRLGFAVAAFLEPEILVVDEVLAVGDAEFQKKAIGKNGAGKSTLLKLLSRVTGPTTGTIKAKGRIASLLEVGTGFHSELTGRENIYMNGTILGMTKKEIDGKIDEIIDFSGCERYIDTPVKRYSSGMTVRLGFAVAAHLDPEILVVDEVLAVGDAEFQKKAIGKMQDVSRGEGRTVLFVSHNMTSIKALCKHGVLLENGGVKYMGDVTDVVNKYLAINADSVDFDESIAARTDRTGDGKIHVNNVVFKDYRGETVEEIFVGEFLKIEFFMEAKDDVNLSEMILSCGFEDVYGNRANEWVSDEIEHDFSNIKNGKVCLTIPSLNLRPNGYFFHFKVSLKDTDDRCICDAMHLVKRLNVLPYATYENGMRLKGGRGFEAIVPAKFD